MKTDIVIVKDMIKSLIYEHNYKNTNRVWFSKDFGLERKVGQSKVYNFEIKYYKNKTYKNSGLLLIENKKGVFYKNLVTNEFKEANLEKVIDLFINQINCISKKSELFYQNT